MGCTHGAALVPCCDTCDYQGVTITPLTRKQDQITVRTHAAAVLQSSAPAFSAGCPRIMCRHTQLHNQHAPDHAQNPAAAKFSQQNNAPCGKPPLSRSIPYITTSPATNVNLQLSLSCGTNNAQYYTHNTMCNASQGATPKPKHGCRTSPSCSAGCYCNCHSAHNRCCWAMHNTPLTQARPPEYARANKPQQHMPQVA